MEELLRAGERIDDLQINGLRIIQNPQGFCFGTDAVLLANYVALKKGDYVVDLGTGTGIIPILLAGKSENTLVKAVEIQSQMADMAERSVKLNRLEHRIQVINGDLKALEKHLPSNSFQVVTSNPPYMVPQGLINPGEAKAISRHEVKCTLEDVVKAAARLLQYQGRFYLIHRPQRLVDILTCCRDHRLEPKQLRFVHSDPTKKPVLLLLECRKEGRPELKFMDPLMIRGESGNYTEELHQIYGKKSLMEGSESHG